jgi:hypothetical protein
MIVGKRVYSLNLVEFSDSLCLYMLLMLAILALDDNLNLSQELPEVSIPRPTPDLTYQSLNESEPSVLATHHRKDLDNMIKYLR